MKHGMCAGCDRIDDDARVTDWHVTTCEAYAKAFAADPGSVRNPAEQYAWWHQHVRPQLKAADLRRRVRATLEQRAAGEARFAGPGDWLGEDD